VKYNNDLVQESDENLKIKKPTGVVPDLQWFDFMVFSTFTMVQKWY
jgi:hypothetical protein